MRRYNEVVEYLQKLTNKKEITQADISKASGLTRSTINYRKINNKEFSYDEFTKIKDYFIKEVQIWDRMYEKCTKDNQIKLLLYYDVNPSCGFGTVANENAYSHICISENVFPKYKFFNKYNAVIAKGDSMSPLIMDKDILIVKECETIENHKIHIFSYDGEIFCKYLNVNINQLIIKSQNVDYEPIVLKNEEMNKIKIWGVVEGIIRNL